MVHSAVVGGDSSDEMPGARARSMRPPPRRAARGDSRVGVAARSLYTTAGGSRRGGFDVILDAVGGRSSAAVLEMRPGGRMVAVGASAVSSRASGELLRPLLRWQHAALQLIKRVE